MKNSFHHLGSQLRLRLERKPRKGSILLPLVRMSFIKPGFRYEQLVLLPSEDCKESLKAFTEKRKRDFKGA